MGRLKNRRLGKGISDNQLSWRRFLFLLSGDPYHYNLTYTAPYNNSVRKNEIGIFEIEGLEGKFHGKLEWGGELSGRLTITSGERLPLTTIEEKLLPRWIHGVLTTGHYVMLPDSNCLSTKQAGGTVEIFSATFMARYVFIGDLSVVEPPLLFDAVHLRLKWFQPWFTNQRVLFGSFPSRLEQPNRLPAFTVENDGESFEIVIVQDTQTSIQGLVYQAETQTKLYLVPRERKEFEWYLAKTNSLWQLVSFITGEESEILDRNGIVIREFPMINDYDGLETELELLPEVKEHIYDIINEARLNYKVKLAMLQKVYSGPEDYTSELLTVQSGSPEFGAIVQSWFSQTAEFHHVVALVLAAARQDDLYLESRLTLLTQAAEALHRALNPEVTAVLPKAEYKILSCNFRAWVSDQTHEAAAEELAGKFGNLNGISFQTRLTRLFEPLWEPFINDHSISYDLIRFVKTVAGARNNLAHANASAGDEVSEQRHLKNLLLQILRILILQHLGWTNEAAIQNVRQQDLSEDLRAYVSWTGKEEPPEVMS